MFHGQVLDTIRRHKRLWKQSEKLKTFRSVMAPLSLSLPACGVGMMHQARLINMWASDITQKTQSMQTRKKTLCRRGQLYLENGANYYLFFETVHKERLGGLANLC